MIVGLGARMFVRHVLAGPQNHFNMFLGSPATNPAPTYNSQFCVWLCA